MEDAESRRATVWAIRESISCCSVVVGPATASTADASGAAATGAGAGVAATGAGAAAAFFAFASFTGAGAGAAAAGASATTSFFATFLAAVVFTGAELIVVLVPVEVFAIFKRTGLHYTADSRQILSNYILLYLKHPDGTLFF